MSSISEGAHLFPFDSIKPYVLHNNSQDNHKIQQCIKNGLVNERNEQGITILMAAADSFCNQNESDPSCTERLNTLVQSLLQAKADPNLRGENGNTALKVAAINGHTAVVEQLIDAGADPFDGGDFEINPHTARMLTYTGFSYSSFQLLKSAEETRSTLMLQTFSTYVDANSASIIMEYVAGSKTANEATYVQLAFEFCLPLLQPHSVEFSSKDEAHTYMKKELDKLSGTDCCFIAPTYPFIRKQPGYPLETYLKTCWEAAVKSDKAPTSTSAYEVATIGNFAYVVDTSGSFRIVDVSNITNPNPMKNFLPT